MCSGKDPLHSIKLGQVQPVLKEHLEIVYSTGCKKKKAFFLLREATVSTLVSGPHYTRDRDRKSELSSKFRVRGIPTLVIVDVDGTVLTTEGREEIGEDPEGKSFPWTPKPLYELLGTEFQTKNGLAGIEAIEGKTLALYFSAFW